MSLRSYGLLSFDRDPLPGRGEVVVLTLKQGANRLDLSVATPGTTTSDRDHLTFVVQ